MSHKMEAAASAKLSERAGKIYDILVPIWPDAVPLLHYRNGFELLCAVMLSAQCTDEQVNKVTPRLFELWPDAAALAKAEAGEVEGIIHSVGFFKTKARHLVETARILDERHGGAIPPTMAELLELPGVGRKTANLVISACHGEPGIIVDTHVLRTMLRLGFGTKADPSAVERLIAAALPAGKWTAFSHAVNRHGKFVCRARKPDCLLPDAPPCPLAGLCPRAGL